MRFCRLNSALILCTGILLTAPSVAALNTSSVFREAKALMLKGDRRGAVGLLRNSNSAELSRKANLLAEQFVTADNFQKFQEVKSYAETEMWSDCLKSAALITDADQDNLSVLRIKALCQLKSSLYDDASKTFNEMLVFDLHEPNALMGLSTIALNRKQYDEALKLVEPLVRSKTLVSPLVEKLSIHRAVTLRAMGQPEEAIQILIHDHEKHLDHVQVIYEIAKFYQSMPGFEWQSRRNYALFVSRYKRLPNTHPDKRTLVDAFTEAQAQLVNLDKKLAVETTPTTSGGR